MTVPMSPQLLKDLLDYFEDAEGKEASLLYKQLIKLHNELEMAELELPELPEEIYPPKKTKKQKRR